MSMQRRTVSVLSMAEPELNWDEDISAGGEVNASTYLDEKYTKDGKNFSKTHYRDEVFSNIESLQLERDAAMRLLERYFESGLRWWSKEEDGDLRNNQLKMMLVIAQFANGLLVEHWQAYIKPDKQKAAEKIRDKLTAYENQIQTGPVDAAPADADATGASAAFISAPEDDRPSYQFVLDWGTAIAAGPAAIYQALTWTAFVDECKRFHHWVGLEYNNLIGSFTSFSGLMYVVGFANIMRLQWLFVKLMLIETIEWIIKLHQELNMSDIFGDIRAHESQITAMNVATNAMSVFFFVFRLILNVALGLKHIFFASGRCADLSVWDRAWHEFSRRCLDFENDVRWAIINPLTNYPEWFHLAGKWIVPVTAIVLVGDFANMLRRAWNDYQYFQQTTETRERQKRAAVAKLLYALRLDGICMPKKFTDAIESSRMVPEVRDSLSTKLLELLPRSWSSWYLSPFTRVKIDSLKALKAQMDGQQLTDREMKEALLLLHLEDLDQVEFDTGLGQLFAQDLSDGLQNRRVAVEVYCRAQQALIDEHRRRQWDVNWWVPSIGTGASLVLVAFFSLTMIIVPPLAILTCYLVCAFCIALIGMSEKITPYFQARQQRQLYLDAGLEDPERLAALDAEVNATGNAWFYGSLQRVLVVPTVLIAFAFNPGLGAVLLSAYVIYWLVSRYLEYRQQSLADEALQQAVPAAPTQYAKYRTGADVGPATAKKGFFDDWKVPSWASSDAADGDSNDSCCCCLC